MINLDNFIKAYREPLTGGELQYARRISDGLNMQIDTVNHWLGSDEYQQFAKYWDLYGEMTPEFMAYARQSILKDTWDRLDIHEACDKLADSNAKSSEEFINRFYREGAIQGVTDLGRTLAFTKADEKALYHLYNYNFNLVKNLNTSLETGIRNSVFEGIAKGESIPKIASRVKDVLTDPGSYNLNGERVAISEATRATMIARTETSRARNVGHLQAYADYGVTRYNCLSAGDDLVCDECLEAEAGSPWSITDMNAPTIPIHPLCRCTVTADTDSITDTAIENPICVTDYDGGMIE